MKKGLLLAAIGGIMAAVGINKMLKKEDVIETDAVEFEDFDDEEAVTSEEESEE